MEPIYTGHITAVLEHITANFAPIYLKVGLGLAILSAPCLVAAELSLRATIQKPLLIADPLAKYQRLQLTHTVVDPERGHCASWLDAVEQHDNSACHVSLGVVDYTLLPGRIGHISSVGAPNAKTFWSWKEFGRTQGIEQEYALLLINHVLDLMQSNRCRKITTTIRQKSGALQEWITLHQECGFVMYTTEPDSE